jgi:tetratricopeptide (TPR) repeat protein
LVLRYLVEASTKDDLPQGSDRERIRLHQLMRSFAATHFAQWPAQHRHNAHLNVAIYYAAYSQAMSARPLEEDEANITRALEWAHKQGLDILTALLCKGMHYFWRDRWRIQASLHYLPWGVAAAEKLVGSTNDQELRVLPAALESSYGFALLHIGKVHEAEQVFQNALTNLRKFKDRRVEGATFSYLGQLTQRKGQLDEAERYFQMALRIFREVQDHHGEGATLGLLGQLAHRRGQLDEAERYFQNALSILREEGDHQSEGTLLSALGRLADHRGQLDEAERYFQEALSISHVLKNRQSEGTILNFLGQVSMQRGQLEMAEEYTKQSLAIRLGVQDRRGESIVLSQLGQIALHRGQLKEAEEYIKQSLTIDREVEDRQSEAVALADLGRIAQARREFDQAEYYYQHALPLARETQDISAERKILSLLEDLAKLQQQQDDPESSLHDAPSDAVLPALQALLKADSLEETRAILEREQVLLLTNTANQLLKEMVAITEQNNDLGRSPK